MKRFLLALLLACPLIGFAQAPIQRNEFTTNNPPKFPLLLPVPSASSNAYPVVHTDFDQTILEWQGMYFNGGTNAFLRGILTAGGGAFSNSLTLNGSPVLTNAPGFSDLVWTNDAGVIHPVDLTLETIQFGPNDTGSDTLIFQPIPTLDGDGNHLRIASGMGGTNGRGGDLVFYAASGTGTENSGDFTIESLSPTGSGDRGNFSLTAGTAGFFIDNDITLDSGGTIILQALIGGVVPTADNVMNFGSPAFQWGSNYIGTKLFIGTNQYTDNGTNLLRNGTPITSTATNFVGIYRDQSIEAGAMFPGPTAATFGQYTNTVNDTLSDSWTFADGVTQSARFALTMPDTWDIGTVKLKLYVTCDTTNVATTTNIVWGVKAGSLGPGEALTNAVFGTQVFVTNGLNIVGNVQQVFLTPAITVGGSPAMGDSIWFDISRQGANASDTWTNTPVRMLKARLQWLEASTAPSSW